MDPVTYNEQVRDAMLRHQVGLLQFSGKVRNDILRLLDASETELRHEIEDRLRNDAGKQLTPAGMDRLKRLLQVLKEARLKSWKDVKEKWFEELFALAKAEPQFMARILDTAIPVHLGLEMPSAETLRAIVTAKPFAGAVLKDWASKAARDDVVRIQNQVQIGMTRGETAAQIARRVVGTTSSNGANGIVQIARDDAERITRTAVMSISNEARHEMYLANSDILFQLVWVATLDSATCLQCQPLDGQLFDVDELFARPPLHFNCRCVLAPAIDGEVVGQRPRRDFTEKGLLREFAKREGLDRVPSSRDRIPHGLKGEYDSWSNDRMGELTGTTAASKNYTEFLTGQSKRFQEDVLGITKARLFRAGAPLKGFVSRAGKELSLADLARSHEEWFRAAGLDPSDFTLN